MPETAGAGTGSATTKTSSSSSSSGASGSFREALAIKTGHDQYVRFTVCGTLCLRLAGVSDTKVVTKTDKYVFVSPRSIDHELLHIHHRHRLD